mmetsp:Transcript_90476/g.240315  ORF Transcript_90476/g.240315 Transcript_90476/m.240315 type:complete len:220 (+) Transcript_90476:620-1279(+)
MRPSRSLHSPKLSSLWALKSSWRLEKFFLRSSKLSPWSFMVESARWSRFWKFVIFLAAPPVPSASSASRATFSSRSWASIVFIWSLPEWMSCCEVPRRLSKLSTCSFSLSKSDLMMPSSFSQCSESLCTALSASAVLRPSSLMLFTMSKCLEFRPSASSRVCETFSLSSTRDLPIFAAPICSARTSASRSSHFCCSAFVSTFEVRRFPAIFAKSDFVTS